MMVLLGGKERTQRQWQALADAANFDIETIVLAPRAHCDYLVLAKRGPSAAAREPVTPLRWSPPRPPLAREMARGGAEAAGAAGGEAGVAGSRLDAAASLSAVSSPEITRGHPRSPEITRDGPRWPEPLTGASSARRSAWPLLGAVSDTSRNLPAGARSRARGGGRASRRRRAADAGAAHMLPPPTPHPHRRPFLPSPPSLVTPTPPSRRGGQAGTLPRLAHRQAGVDSLNLSDLVGRMSGLACPRRRSQIVYSRLAPERARALLAAAFTRCSTHTPPDRIHALTVGALRDAGSRASRCTRRSSLSTRPPAS